MTSQTPYDKARALLEAGRPHKDVVQALCDGGLDRDSAAVVVSSLAARSPMSVEEFGDISLSVAPEASQGRVLFDKDSAADATINVVFGLLTAAAGITTVLLWGMDRASNLWLFSPFALALLLFRFSDITFSLVRLALWGLLVRWAVFNQEHGFIVAGSITFLYGAYRGVRGLIVLQRLHAPQKAPAVAGTPEAPPDASPPAVSRGS